MTTRKVYLLCTIIFLGLLTSSCKKEYVCQCVSVYTEPAYTNSNGQYVPQVVRIYTITNTFKSKKKYAESGCKRGESITSYPSPNAGQGQGSITEVVTCELK
jgi:hypothetical protein